MLSSYRVIKNQNVSHDSGTSYIETRIDLPAPVEEIELEIDEDKFDEVAYCNEIRKEVMIKMQVEREAILKEAKIQAEVIKTEAYREGHGKGYQIGYNEGIIKAREEGEVIKAKAIRLVNDADEYVKGYYKETALASKSFYIPC